MNSIIPFPAKTKVSKVSSVNSELLASASAASEFIATALRSLEAVAVPLERRLAELTNETVDQIYACVDAVVASGVAGMDECLLYELIHEEVARRCFLRGLPMPWSEYGDADDLANPANDAGPSGNGAA